MKTISTTRSVLGMTSVDDELFALLKRDKDQVAVYSINDYQLLRHLNLPGFQPHSDSDIASSVRHKCLFMSDRDNKCVLGYGLARSATSKWSTPGKPCGLSITPSCNLLATCRVKANLGKLVEMSADSGQCMREIALQATIVSPWHSVQLATGQFVVCSLSGVSVVGSDGIVTRSYGDQQASKVGHLNGPSHLAVDEDLESIFVTDHDSHRVVLSSTTLEFERYVIEKLSRPHRLYFHQATRRLFVGQDAACVTVIQL